MLHNLQCKQQWFTHLFALWDAHQVHLRLQGKLFSVPPTMKHNVTVNVYDVMENKPTLNVKMHSFRAELKLSLMMFCKEGDISSSKIKWEESLICLCVWISLWVFYWLYRLHLPVRKGGFTSVKYAIKLCHSKHWFLLLLAQST